MYSHIIQYIYIYNIGIINIRPERLPELFMILPFVLAAATTAGGVAFLINLRILQHEFQQRNLKHTTILNQQNIYCSSAIIIIIII